MEEVPFEDFKKLDIRIGTVLSSGVVEGADKLLKLEVDVGEEKPRQIVSGIREYVPGPDFVVGKQYPFILNIPKRTIRGTESHGMILAVAGDSFSLLSPENQVPPGSEIS